MCTYGLKSLKRDAMKLEMPSPISREGSTQTWTLFEPPPIYFRVCVSDRPEPKFRPPNSPQTATAG